MNNTTIDETEMSLPEKFGSHANKRLLWDIMVENNVFTGLSNKYFNNIKADFERILQGFKSIISVNDSILELNKKSILRMMEEVKKYRETTPLNVPVTSADLLTKKQEQFQKGLQTKQEEFNRLIQPVKPQIIDFSDNIDDEPIGSEMDMKLSQTITWREQQLSQVLEKQNPTEATEWLNNGKRTIANTNSNVKYNTTPTANTNVNSTNHIKIGDPTNIDENSFINLKKVSFAEDNVRLTINNRETNDKETNNKETNVSNFMDKLKKKNSTEDITPGFEILKAELTGVKAELTGVKAELTGVKAELNIVKAELTGVKAELNIVKADLTTMKSDLSKILLDNKLILENQEKIMDKLEQVAFQTGSI
jgi:hypothetical protein